MGKSEPKFRKALNTGQIEVLKLLYTFRFATSKHIASYQDSHEKSVYFRLKVLLEQGYIGRHHDAEYYLRRQHAAYFLLPKGMKILRDLPDFDTTVINSVYKDKVASEQFRDRSLAIFGVACKLGELYSGRLKFFTKSNLAKFDYFPKPPPDGFLRLHDQKDESGDKHFFVDYYDLATPFFVHRRKVENYIKYDDEGEWDATKTDPPVVLAVCESPALQKRLAKRMVAAIDGSMQTDVKFYITAVDKLQSSVRSDDAIWQDTSEPDVLLSLEAIS